MDKKYIFDRLWIDYISRNPLVKQVYDEFTRAGENVVNDHIAFRTFNDKRVNIEVLSKPFKMAGYVEKGEYYFKDKHLNAKHYEHSSDSEAPRVFISELILEDFSDDLRESAAEWIASIPEEMLNSEDLIFSGYKWNIPSFRKYEDLRKESEYAAWLYVNGFRANHFTVSVNYLKGFRDILQVNEFLKNKGFKLNDSGGEVKGTRKDLLRQSSIMAGKIKVQFAEGEKETPGCYYEFAERFTKGDGKIFNGFIAGSADKIFESTDNIISGK